MTGVSLRLIRGILDAFPRWTNPQHQVIGAGGTDGHLLEVLKVEVEVEVLHQLLADRAEWIYNTRCSAPMATCRT
ncbi:TPA: hypothetical protein NIC12_006170 [Pseudomonas aeruginosa]|nr:hypothetical protein [Pseudomonas aeruginosa]HCF3507883.1 hypothetical protein [Pseudomonas aeruginosa]